MSIPKGLESLSTLPFNFHRLDRNNLVATSVTGDFIYLSQEEIAMLIKNPNSLPRTLKTELQAKFFLENSGDNSSLRKVVKSRIAAKKETVLGGIALFIIVPTLQCEHTCQYCQVSRSLEDTGYAMTEMQIDKSIDSVFQSSASSITVEFQGGDPLLRFDLIKRAIERLKISNANKSKKIRIVVTSTLHQLTPDMCRYFKENNVYLSTSIDGPKKLHNQNRPVGSRDSYDRTLEGINLARSIIGFDSVSALMTTTKKSINYPVEIVDEYVKLGFNEIFIRPVSLYGFAKRNQNRIYYDNDDFLDFYHKSFERVLYWNNHGVELREATASLIFNKILSPFDSGYVDMQSPNGAGLATLVFNYDGYIYPSDEARMLAETGDVSFRLGEIGDSIVDIRQHPVVADLINASMTSKREGCIDCAFNSYCGPDPVGDKAKYHTMKTEILRTDFCKRQKSLFDYFFRLLLENKDIHKLAYDWAYL